MGGGGSNEIACNEKLKLCSNDALESTDTKTERLPMSCDTEWNACCSACEALMPGHVMHRCGEALRVNRAELLPGTLPMNIFHIIDIDPINIYHIIDIDPIYSKTASSNSKTDVAPAERKAILQEEN